MKTDALNRRKRTEIQPTGKDPVLNGAVLNLLEGLRRYHPLPPRLAFRLWNGGNYYPYFQDKLTDLTHERPGGEAPVILRSEYFNPKGVLNSEPVWYELSPRGYAIAEGRAPHPIELLERDHIKHRAFNASVGASFEVLAPEYGLSLLTLEDILAHKRCPEATRTLRNPLAIPLPGERHVEPDRLFGLSYGENRFRFFAVEIDRATETNRRTVFGKLDRWSEVMSAGLHTSFYGLPNMRVMFITTAPGRITQLLQYLDGKPHADKFVFKALPNFGDHWRAPREPVAELFDQWETMAGPFDITKL